MKQINKHTRPRTCPHLGMADDPQTSLAFPSVWNYCNHADPVEAVATEHQQNYCLTARYVNCPVFIRKTAGPLPANMKESVSQTNAGGNLWRISAAVGTVVVIILLSAMAIVQTRRQDNQLTVIVTDTPAATIMPTASSTATPALPTQTLTYTPESLPQSALEILGTESAMTPRVPGDIENLIGADYLFRIHRVGRGENLETIAQREGTSVEAISAINFQFTTPLWVDQIIIIPVNRTDVSGLPVFQAYRVPEAITVETLAAQQNVDLLAFKLYNALPDGILLEAGEWVLLPR